MIRDKRYGTAFRGWKVLEYLEEKTNDGHKLYMVKCPFCGYIKEKTVLSDLFQANNLCLHHIKKVRKWPSGLRSIFLSMKKRCYDCSGKDYRYYGAKGITICDEWLNDPNTFVQWAESNGYHKGLTIDRIDSLREYSPDNCRWIPLEENSKWKSTTNSITVDGITDSGRSWSLKIGHSINYVNTYMRKHGIKETIDMIRNNLSAMKR